MQGEQNQKELLFTYRQYLEQSQSLPSGTIIGKYKIIREIGKGAFGKIYLAETPEKVKFAAKLMDLEKVRRQPNPRVKEIRERLVKNQAKLMQLCDSPNILKCYQIFQNDSLKVLILEYCSGQTLQDYIDKKRVIKEDEAVRILRQIINGIAEMHKHNIIHRDLKAENIMEHEGQYKIIDLGFSKKLQIAHEYAEVKGTTLGTVTTMAPQVLLKSEYGLKADIWSIGVIFFQMVFGVMLYDSISAKQRLRQIEEKKMFSKDKPLQFRKITISTQANDFLFGVLQVKTQKRMGWRELLEHPLIKGEQEQPIGDRFLRKHDLKQPIINKDLEDNKIREQSSLMPLTQSKTDMPKINPQIKKEGIKEKFKLKLIEENDKIEEQQQKQRKNINQIKQLQYKKRQVEDYKGKPAYLKETDESAEYVWCRKGHLECVKTQLIYYQLIVPIQTNKFLDFDDRCVSEFMFLISARCFNNMSPIAYKIANKSKKQNAIVNDLYKQVEPLYQKVKEKFNTESNRLTSLQNSFSQMFLDFFRKRFLAGGYNQKSQFTSGIQHNEFDKVEGYGDYNKNEQIDYTFKNYVAKIIRIIEEKTSTRVTKKIIGYLRCYDKIMKVTLQDLDGESFSEFVRRNTTD